MRSMGSRVHAHYPRHCCAQTTPGLELPAERPAALRRIMWLGGSAAAALSVWSAWGLWSVETGRVEGAEVWGPVAAVYRHFGFWPAALTCPALGVLIVSSARTKLRKLEAEAAAARPPA